MQDPVITIKSGGEITPFWQRIPKFFLYPFHTGPLLYIALLSAGSLLAIVLPVFLVEIGIALAALRYAFRILEQTSLGYLTPEQHELDAKSGRANLPYKLLGILLGWGLIAGFVTAVSPMLGLAVNLFVTLALPASVMSLSVTNSFFGGLNPASWITIMRAVGKPYLALWVFLFLLMGGGPIVLRLVMPMLGGWLQLPVVNFVFIYFTLVMFNMMGYCIYQYHHMLGLGVKVDFDQAHDGSASAKAAKPSDTVGEEIAAKVAAGDLKGALQAAYEQHRTAPDDVAVQERYFKLLQLGDKPDHILRHARELISLLLRKERGERALQVFKTCRATNPDFAPENPAEVFKLAQAARRARDYVLALALVRDFDKSNPRHPDVPAARLMSAQILSENLKKDDIAADILKGILQKFPEHPLSVEAAAYLKALERLAALKPVPPRA
jgi:tetratricopeptide (TPR) repeat protein